MHLRMGRMRNWNGRIALCVGEFLMQNYIQTQSNVKNRCSMSNHNQVALKLRIQIFSITTTNSISTSKQFLCTAQLYTVCILIIDAAMIRTTDFIQNITK